MKFDHHAAEIVLDIDPRLPGVDRKIIIEEYERGCIHIVTYYVLKYAHATQAPHSMAGIASSNHNKGVEAYNTSIAAPAGNHPVLDELKEAELVEEAACWIEQGWDDDCVDNATPLPNLRTFACRLRLGSSVERAVEAEHAQTKREVGRVPNHSDALVSLAHRFPALSDYISTDEDRFQDLAMKAALVRDGREACEILGLQDRPSTHARRKFKRDPVHWKVVHNSDLWSATKNKN